MTLPAPRPYAPQGYETFTLHSAEGAQFEVFVSLPYTYGTGAKRYPVLYLGDAAFYFGAASDIVRLESLQGTFIPDAAAHMDVRQIVPEMIVVAVGIPSSDPFAGMQEFLTRRVYDYFPDGDIGARGRDVRALLEAIYNRPFQFGGAPGFLDLLADQLKPAINALYRTTPESAYFGHSGGGHFGLYALSHRPETFNHYILGSPYPYVSGELLFDMEAAYDAAHSDLPASVFLAAGAREAVEGAPAGAVSGMVRFAEALAGRAYPSLKLHLWFAPDEAHTGAALPILIRGLNVLLKD